MKKFLSVLSLLMASATLVLAPMDYAEAKRLGGGRPAGMQRQMPPKQPAQQPQQQPGQQNNAAAPVNGAAATGGAAAAAGKRSWMGPIAGLAAGLGIAALMSHLGMGEAFGNFLTMALLAIAAVFVIRFLMRRFGGGAQQQRSAYAGAGAGHGGASPFGAPASSGQAPLRRQMDPMPPAAGLSPAPIIAAASSSGPVGLPEGMSAADFERVAKMLFIRLQASNDAGQVDDLRKFTTPELFASLRLDLQDRGNAGQQTDVMQLDAELVDTAQEDGHWVASVRFHGLIRERAEQPAEAFDELWHFIKPLAGDRDWAIAGISPVAA
ncbi:MAG: Tim44 domain-containing protein [Rubrivivax sp.]|nr:MAG: Tim44 domain-containing protein [Rubrivivax sp.]